MKKLFIILITFIPIFAFLCGQTILPKEKEGSINVSNLGNTFGSISPFNISNTNPDSSRGKGLIVYPLSLSGFNTNSYGPSDSQIFYVAYDGGLYGNIEIRIDSLSYFPTYAFEIAEYLGGNFSIYEIFIDPIPEEGFPVPETPIYVRMKEGLEPGLYTQDIIIQTYYQKAIVSCSGVVYQNYINPINETLNTFYCNEGSGPSEEQFFTITESYMANDIIIYPPAGFEISLTGTSASESFVPQEQITLSPKEGVIPETKIYVRMAGLSYGVYSENITISSSGLDNQYVYCQGEVCKVIVTLNDDNFQEFHYLYACGPSSEKSFTISGSNFPYTTNNIYIYAPSCFEISTESGEGFSCVSPIILSSADVNENIYVRLSAGLGEGTYQGAINIMSDYIGCLYTINCRGNVDKPLIVMEALDLPELFYYEGYGPSFEQLYIVWGKYLSHNLIINASENLEISTESEVYTDNGNQITLTPNENGFIQVFLYVRLKEGISEGTYSEQIEASTEYAEPCIIHCYGAVGPHFDYLAGREYTEKGIKFVINNNCNRGSGYIPQFTNPDLIYTDFTFSVDNSIANWTITMWTDADFGAYYQNEEWHIVDNNGGQVVFNISFAPGKGIVEIPVILYNSPTLSVQLSAFTLNLNSQHGINVMWISQSETGLNGYYIHRGTVDDLSQATIISPLIRATNTSHQQVYLYTDKDIYEPGTYYYWLEAQDYDGYVTYYGSRNVIYSIDNNQGTPELPLVTEIKSIFPNPFNPTAIISYTISKPAEVNFAIYNPKGQLIRSFNLGRKDTGNYRLVWDGTDNKNQFCGTGVYYIRMQAGKESFIKKAALIK